MFGKYLTFTVAMVAANAHVVKYLKILILDQMWTDFLKIQ